MCEQQRTIRKPCSSLSVELEKRPLQQQLVEVPVQYSWMNECDQENIVCEKRDIFCNGLLCFIAYLLVVNIGYVVAGNLVFERPTHCAIRRSVFEKNLSCIQEDGTAVVIWQGTTAILALLSQQQSFVV